MKLIAYFSFSSVAVPRSADSCWIRDNSTGWGKTHGVVENRRWASTRSQRNKTMFKSETDNACTDRKDLTQSTNVVILNNIFQDVFTLWKASQSCPWLINCFSWAWRSIGVLGPTAGVGARDWDCVTCYTQTTKRFYFSSLRLPGNQMKNYLNSHQRTIQGSFLILWDALQFRVNCRNQTIADVFRNAIASYNNWKSYE